jgi:hypothetical protein
MATNKSKEASKKAAIDGEIFFITDQVRPRNSVGFQEHSDKGGNALSKKASEVKEDWNIMMAQLSDIMSNTEKTTESSRYQMDEITVKLGFTAKGKIAFIAEAGVEASIEVKFKRK